MARPERFELPTTWFEGWGSLTYKLLNVKAIMLRAMRNIFPRYADVSCCFDWSANSNIPQDFSTWK